MALGDVSLAHHRVFLLDELPEFRGDVLAARQWLAVPALATSSHPMR